MPNYTITISSDGQPVIDKAFAAENARRVNAYKTIDDFLTAQIEDEFGISAAEIKATQQRDAFNAVVAKIAPLPVSAITEIAVAVDATIAKQPK